MTDPIPDPVTDPTVVDPAPVVEPTPGDPVVMDPVLDQTVPPAPPAGPTRLPGVTAPSPTPAETEPTVGNSPIIGSMVCTAAGCSNQGNHIVLHADTVQPVHCGGCYAVLQCDHTRQETATVRTGTIGAPRELTTTTCLDCSTVLVSNTVTLPPIDLNDLPVEILDAPL